MSKGVVISGMAGAYMSLWIGVMNWSKIEYDPVSFLWVSLLFISQAYTFHVLARLSQELEVSREHGKKQARYLRRLAHRVRYMWLDAKTAVAEEVEEVGAEPVAVEEVEAEPVEEERAVEEAPEDEEAAAEVEAEAAEEVEAAAEDAGWESNDEGGQ